MTTATMQRSGTVVRRSELLGQRFPPMACDAARRRPRSGRASADIARCCSDLRAARRLYDACARELGALRPDDPRHASLAALHASTEETVVTVLRRLRRTRARTPGDLVAKAQALEPWQGYFEADPRVGVAVLVALLRDVRAVSRSGTTPS